MTSKTETKKTPAAKTETKKGTTKPDDDGIPEGFDSLNAENSRLWFKPDFGDTAQGVMLGEFSRNDGEAYYQVEVTKPFQVADYSGEKEGYEEFTAQIGDIVNVKAYKMLATLMAPILKEEEVFHEVAIAPEAKHKCKKGSYWSFKAGSRRASNFKQ